MDAMTGKLLVELLTSDLVKDTLANAAGLIASSGRKLGQKAKEYLEKQKLEESPDGEAVPQEVQEEVKSTIKEMLMEHAEPVYMNGVALFSDRAFKEEALSMSMRMIL